MNDLEAAKYFLNKGYTCVLVKGESIIFSQKGGIAPLIDLIDSGMILQGYSAADKIVGKAAALLYAKMGVKNIYAQVASLSALEVCKGYGITIAYGLVTEKILNRRGDGMCPMEQIAEEVNDPNVAYERLKAKVSALKI